MKNIILLILGLSLSIGTHAQHVSNSEYNFTKIAELSIGDNGYANIWGYVQNNKEYALLGCSGSNTLNDACAIIDVTNPSNPTTLFRVQGPPSLWREVRTYQHYAYITTEAANTSFGITIVDLQYLPDSIKTKQYTANGIIGNVHALHIDDGFLYLYGANNSVSQSGALILNLSDPWNPTVAGAYTNKYVHDGIVRNNKMYSGEIFSGTFSIVDVTNKANPVVLNTQVTPAAFTHNTWLSTNSKYLFTTDEITDSYVTSYDIQDPQNIIELDRYRTQNPQGAIPHNTYILNDSSVTGSNTDYLATSYYTEGVTMVDAHKPDNLVEVAKYDTNPLTGSNYEGAWGVYPYLPSGNVLVSDMQLGLFILDPNYQRACYLEGIVTDVSNNLPIPNVKVTILTNGKEKRSNTSGIYKTGIVNEGLNTVRFEASGYQTKELEFNLLRGQTVNGDVQLNPTLVGIQPDKSLECKIYPSNVINELYIEKSSDIKLHLVLNDINGKAILSQKLNSQKEIIDLNGLSIGTYIVQILSDNKIIKTEKIIKE